MGKCTPVTVPLVRCASMRSLVLGAEAFRTPLVFPAPRFSSVRTAFRRQRVSPKASWLGLNVMDHGGGLARMINLVSPATERSIPHAPRMEPPFTFARNVFLPLKVSPTPHRRWKVAMDPGVRPVLMRKWAVRSSGCRIGINPQATESTSVQIARGDDRLRASVGYSRFSNAASFSGEL